MITNIKKHQKSMKDNESTKDITNDSKSSNSIVDIDDSPDVATWNKEVTRTKEHFVNDIKISEETKNKDRISNISSKIPPTTTLGLRIEDNDGPDDQIDPANQKDLDKIYNSDNKLTDHADLFKNKKNTLKSKKTKNTRSDY
jgi:hypothetical protein